MSSIQNFFTSRDNNTDGNTYVGQLDRLWYNPTTNSIFVSDGTTPGGNPVELAANANAAINNLTVNTVTANVLTSSSGTLNLTGNITISGNISPAAEGKIGGIYPGPGVVISNQGELTIDTANLPLSFGNFTASNNVLGIVNVDENMILQTEGSAEIQLIGNVGFYKPDGLPPDTANRYAFFNNDGQVTILVPDTDVDSAFKIIGSTTGDYIAPGIEGALLHITGQLDVPSRSYYDGNGDYVAWVARRWNGNVSVPTQVLADEDVLRINATAATDAGVGNVAMAQIQFRALENQTTTAQGSTMNFIVTPVGSSAASRVEVANVTVANGVTATKFTTSGTVSATGNITAGNVTATAYTGLVTHTVRNAGAVGGTTLTLDVTTDDIVKCTFNDNFTVAFGNIIPGRVVTLVATNNSAGDTDIITAGISAVNMQGDSTLTVTQQTTSVVTYYSTGTTTGDIFASAVYN